MTDHPRIVLPPLVQDLATAVDEHGGRAFAVGGVVRDHLLGRDVADWDLEVHEVSEKALYRLLRGIGQVDTVGRAFAVFKLTRKGLTLDVSLPRTDSKAGPGHKGIAVRGDPFLGVQEASRRRDLTVNAILYDLITHTYVDPYGGMADLRERRLRAVDANSFLEDPLCALRVVQFAARLNAEPDHALLDLCRRAPIDELPPERIRGEWFKLLLADHPSRGMDVAVRATLLERAFPGAPTDTGQALDRLTPLRDDASVEGRRLALMLTTWLLPATPRIVVSTLDRLGFIRWGGYRLREAVLRAHAAQDLPCDSDASLRQLATRCEVGVVLAARWAVTQEAQLLRHRERARELNVLTAPEDAWVQGRDLLAMGARPGPHIGEWLDALYADQLTRTHESRDCALAAAALLVEQAPA